MILTVCMGAFGFIDRIVIATLGEAIKRDLNLSDFQLGVLGGLSFALLYSVVGLPIARLAERKSRINIIAASIALFSIATVLCGLAANFWQLFMLRIAVGIGEAGVQAPAVSLLADHFNRDRRGAVMAVMKLGSPLGAFVGVLAAGWIGTQFGWRAAIISIAAPGIVVAILYKLTLHEPPRGMSDPEDERQEGVPPPFMAVISEINAKPGFRHMLVGLGLVTITLFGSSAFYAPFFMRVHELTLGQVGAFYAIQSGVAATVGYAISGFAIDVMSRRQARWYALLPALGVGLSVPFNLIGYSAEGPTTSLIFLTIGATLIFVHGVPTLVAFQNMVGTSMRATAAFIFFFVTTVVGLGLGPAVVGFVSDIYASALFDGGKFSQLCPGGQAGREYVALAEACAAAATKGVRYALLTATLFAAWSSIHYSLASRAIQQNLHYGPMRKLEVDPSGKCNRSAGLT